MSVLQGQKVVHGGLQRPPLPQIFPVAKQGALRIFHSALKPDAAIGAASVVHQQDRFKSGGHQAFHHAKEFFVGIQRGNNCGNVHKMPSSSKQRSVAVVYDYIIAQFDPHCNSPVIVFSKKTITKRKKEERRSLQTPLFFGCE
jgi:hypothetical protein